MKWNLPDRYRRVFHSQNRMSQAFRGQNVVGFFVIAKKYLGTFLYGSECCRIFCSGDGISHCLAYVTEHRIFHSRDGMSKDISCTEQTKGCKTKKAATQFFLSVVFFDICLTRHPARNFPDWKYSACMSAFTDALCVLDVCVCVGIQGRLFVCVIPFHTFSNSSVQSNRNCATVVCASSIAFFTGHIARFF